MGIRSEFVRTSGERRRRITRKALRLLAIIAATYMVVCVLVDLLQARLIYFPSRDYHSTPADIGLAYDDLTLTTADGVDVAAWYMPAADAHGSVIFCHGNGGNLSDRLEIYQSLHRLGFAVLAFDYRGYGRSNGKTTERGTYLDADAAWTYLVESRGETPARIAVMGESLGGAVAIELASRRAVGALVVESTFTSLVDIGRLHYPLLPVQWLLRHRYDSLERIGGIACPKLFIHARDDELVPLSNAHKLFEHAREPKQFLETPGGHNTGGFTYNAEYVARVGAFLDAALQALLPD